MSMKQNTNIKYEHNLTKFTVCSSGNYKNYPKNARTPFMKEKSMDVNVRMKLKMLHLFFLSFQILFQCETLENM